MTWWAWVIVWLLLVLAAACVLFLIGRSLWAKGIALFEEFGAASERLAVVSEELGALAGRQSEPGLAVFEDPVDLRRRRDRDRRRQARATAKRRRDAHLR